jgi:hypothetical protein
MQSAATILPHVNYMGASTEEVELAVRFVEVVPDLGQHFMNFARQMEAAPPYSREQGTWGLSLTSVPPAMRLALEMISHEDQERRALEGELHELEAMWREAEEIASISDNLFLPRGVTEFLRKNKEKQ